MLSKSDAVKEKELDGLIGDLQDLTSNMSDLTDVSSLLKQLQAAGDIMDLIDSKAEKLLGKMDEILKEETMVEVEDAAKTDSDVIKDQ